MNQLKPILIFLLGSFILCSASCRKADYKAAGTTVATTDHTVLNLAFNALKPAPLDLIVIAGVYTEVRLPKGSKLRFYPNTFKDASGHVLNGDSIRVSVIEMYGAGAGLANRIANVSGNQLLKNGGQIYITAARVRGGDVQVNKYGVCFFSVAPSAEPMGLYYGNRNYEDSMVRWMRVGNMTGTAVQGTTLDSMSVYLVDTSGTKTDTTQIYRNYNVFDSCTSLNWVGCNYPYAVSTPLTNISISPASNTFTDANTGVFLVFPEINAVVPVTEYNRTTHAFTLPAGYEVPSGLTTNIIVVGYNGANFYFFQQDNFTLGTGMSFVPQMTVLTTTEILNLLYQL